MSLTRLVCAAGIAALSCLANAQTSPASAVDHAAHHAASAAVSQSDGEVRKVDKAQGKLTLRHGPLDNLSMPAMTMVFKVADRKMLDGVKEGDKVKFTAERVDGALTVTALQPAR